MIVKLGTPFCWPLFRMKAARRPTSCGSSFFELNCAITYCCSGKLSSGPRSTSSSPWSTKAGAIMKPSAGTVTSAPIAAPMPSVESSRKTLRG